MLGKSYGLTLIELLIAVAIIGIIATIDIPRHSLTTNVNLTVLATRAELARAS